LLIPQICCNEINNFIVLLGMI